MRELLLSLSLFLSSIAFNQANVSELYSDYNGFWNGSASSTVVPDTSHNLLGFKVNGVVYSTNVDDAKLAANNIAFDPQEFKSFPPNSGIVYQYIGVGYRYKGNGNISPIPVINNPNTYLTDGINGLDIGTAIFNSTGTIVYTVPNIDPASIGDGIPDIIVTQVGDPAASTDKFRFIDANGNTIGVQKSIAFNGLSRCGRARWKFYTNTPAYASSPSNSQNGQRDIRVIAYELSDFGIDASNFGDITSFVHVLSGSSDQAFIAYNTKGITFLPVELTEFQTNCDDGVQVSWKTATEKNSDYFEVFRSRNGVDWESFSTVKAAGNSTTEQYYSVIDELNTTTMYYKLHAIDFDGSLEEFPLISSTCNAIEEEWGVFPNPATTSTTVSISFTKVATGLLTLNDNNGRVIEQREITLEKGVNNYLFDTRNLKEGLYFFSFYDEKGNQQSLKFVK